MYDDTPPGVATLIVRALGPHDASLARAMLLPAWDEGNPHVEGLLGRLDRAARQESSEALGIVATIEDSLVGVALFGLVAGAAGTAALHGIYVAEDLRQRGIGSAMLRGIVKILIGERARLLVAEVPDDREHLAEYQGFLRKSSFVEEGRVPDLVRDGQGMALWRRDFQHGNGGGLQGRRKADPPGSTRPDA